MTLIASTRVPDGIVIAADSMSTLTIGRKASAKGKTKCPHCGQEHEFSAPVEIPLGPGITSTLPYAQKLQHLWNRYGVGSHGSSLLGEKTVFAIIQEFERQGDKSKNLRTVADALAKHLQTELKKMPDFSAIPDKMHALGFQIVGYEDGKALTISVDIEKEIQSKDWTGFGTTVSGDIFVATNLWKLKGLGPQLEQPYGAWSIQDAAEYCGFLIETTAKYQRFANVIPTVGGEIDIGFVTPRNRFRWIKCKPLASMLIEEGNEDECTK